MLVALEALSEVVLGDEAAAHEEVERPVDGRLADALAAVAQDGRDVVDGEVALGAEDDVGDDLALVRHRQADLAQIPSEETDVRRALAHDAHATPSSSNS